MNEKIDTIRQIILPILLQEGVLRSSLFGSFASGEHTTDSDIDVLVELPQGKSLLDLIALEQKLEAVLGRDVDLVTYNSINPRLKEHIDKNQIQIL